MHHRSFFNKLKTEHRTILLLNKTQWNHRLKLHICINNHTLSSTSITYKLNWIWRQMLPSKTNTRFQVFKCWLNIKIASVWICIVDYYTNDFEIHQKSTKLNNKVRKLNNNNIQTCNKFINQFWTIGNKIVTACIVQLEQT